MTLDYIDSDEVPIVEHYAFLVSESEFDAIFGRIQAAQSWNIGRTRCTRARRRSIATTAAAACTGTIRTATTWKSSHGRTAAAHDAGLLIRSLAMWPPSTAAGRLNPRPTTLNQVGNSPVPMKLINMPSTPNASALKYGMLRASRAAR